MTEPLVSIIMPVYNRSHLVLNAIDSIVAQTYRKWELWILDDGSTDDTVDVIQRHTQDPRIHVIGLPHAGVAMARNAGLDRSTGTYIAFLDSDDTWPAHKLATQVNVMLTTGARVSVGYFIDRTDESDPHPFLRTCPSPLTLHHLLIDNCILFQTLMAHHSLKSTLRFPDCRHEDYAVALRLVRQRLPLVVIEEVLTYRQRHRHSLSANKWRSALWRYRIYRDEAGLSVISSGLYLLAYAWVSITRRPMR